MQAVFTSLHRDGAGPRTFNSCPGFSSLELAFVCIRKRVRAGARLLFIVSPDDLARGHKTLFIMRDAEAIRQSETFCRTCIDGTRFFVADTFSPHSVGDAKGKPIKSVILLHLRPEESIRALPVPFL